MKSSPPKKIFCIAILAILCITAVLYVVKWKLDKQAEAELEQEVLNLTPGPPPGGDFTLQSADGPVSLSDMRRKVVLLFFGYTSCPTACPMSLDNIAAAFSKLSEIELNLVQGIFVSFDPERDTIDNLKEYTGYFHPSIIGLTGERDVLKEVTKKYGAYYIKTVQGESAMGYTFSHSTEIYVIAPDGSLREILTGTTPPESILETIRQIVRSENKGGLTF